jgi:hypothetical protein
MAGCAERAGSGQMGRGFQRWFGADRAALYRAPQLCGKRSGPNSGPVAGVAAGVQLVAVAVAVPVAVVPRAPAATLRIERPGSVNSSLVPLKTTRAPKRLAPGP